MSSLLQIKDCFAALEEYHTAIKDNLVSTANALPSFEDYITRMEVPNVLVDSVASENRSSSFATGALTDTVHRADAVKREMNVRTKSKSAYFSDATDDLGTQTVFYKSMYAKYLNYIRRTSPEQAKD